MPDRPVVLVLIKGLGIGGAERLIVEAAGYWNLSRYDYRVAYLLPWKANLVPELVDRGVPVTLVGVGNGLGPRSMRRLRRLITDSKAAVVHAHLPTAGLMARIVSPVPVIYTEHNLADSYRRPTRLANRLTYARNARVIAVSDAVARSVAGYPGRRPVTIPNGVTVEVSRAEIDRAREQLPLAGRRLVVHVGNIRPHKGHGTLLEAAATLRSAREDFLLVSIGGEKYPGDLERLQAEIARLGLSGIMQLLGRRPDALAFLAAADVVVNPSDVEGLPLVVLEAMALGRPVVATAVGGVPDVIVHEKTGLLVEPSDPVALAVGIERVLDDPKTAAQMGELARGAIHATHGLERMVRATEEVYDDLLEAC